MQYRNGNFTAAGSPAAITINIGWVPDHVILYCASTTPAAVIYRSEWLKGMASPSAFITTNTAGVGTTTYITTNGISVFSNGGAYTNTVYNITGISKTNPAVVTMADTTGLANGDTVTISNVKGMTQVNTNRYVIAGLTGTTFNLYDTFGNAVNATAYTTYATGPASGEANVISTPVIAPVLNPVNGQVLTPGQPPGNVYDTGAAGFVVGTATQTASAAYFWEAFLQTPTGY